MSKLYFRHSTMNAGKSAHVTMTYHNYKKQNKKALLFTSILDNRYGLKVSDKKFTYTKSVDIFELLEKHNVGDMIDLEGNIFAIGLVKSRIKQLEEKAIAYFAETNLYEIVEQNPCNAVIVDESQFLKKAQVLQLTDIVDFLRIPTMAYGLKVDFLGELFEGSQYLLANAEKIEELKTVCVFCDSKATRNMRVINGIPTFDGEQIVIGDNEIGTKVEGKEKEQKSTTSYIPTCRKCEKKMKVTGKLIKKIDTK